MVRKKTDPFWHFVEKRPKDRWMCKFCGNEYSGRASRIKAHLGQVTNRGVEVCDKVDDGVRAQALKAPHLKPTERQEDMVEETAQGDPAENISSINPSVNFNELQDLNPSMYNQNAPRDAPHNVMSQFMPLSTDFENVGSNLTTLHTQIQSAVLLPDFCMQQHKGNTVIDTAQDPLIVNVQGQKKHHPAGVNMALPSTSSNFGEQLGALKRKVKELRKQKEEKEEELHHWLKKIKQIKNAYVIMEEKWREGKLPSLKQVNQLEIWIREVEGLQNPGSMSTKALLIAAHDDNSPPPLITTELIGRQSEMSEIWNYLLQDDILRLGIYGMGGVGKTDIVMHIYNKLLENNGFDHVFWATIPHDFNIYEIQDVIGNAVHFDDLLKEKNEKIRASMLYRFLISKKKSVLILDGLWRHFEFYDVGIPVKFSGLKLVITSRSLDVCRMMLCQAQIRISPLLFSWNGEDLNLFLVKLGPGIVLTSEMKEIAVQIVSTCEGLPLYITAVARKLRAVKNVRDWKDMLAKMKDPEQRFKEMSYIVYDTLKLSYDSLDDQQLQQSLIFSAFYIASRRYSSRRDLVEFLVDAGLIWGMDGRQKLFDKAHAILDKLENACLIDGDVTMHDSIIDMALHIRSDKVPCITHFTIGLKDILNEEFWFEGLDKMSFVIDGREESPDRSPNFSKISVLLSNHESYLEMIPDLMLRLLSGLTILDLSESMIKEIPHSVSDLINLTALVLRHCVALAQVPYIGKLTSLMKLDLYGCNSLTNLPEGLECLVKLNYLNLYRTSIENLPRSILSNLKKLQYLWINDIKAEELVGLNKLESLCCCFSSMEELNVHAHFVKDEGPNEYNIHVGRLEFREYQWVDDYPRAVFIYECRDMDGESHGDRISLPKNIQKLVVDSWSCERIMLSDCFPLENLEALEIYNCMKFGEIFGGQIEGFMLSSSDASPFPNLKKLKVASCSKLKYLLGPGIERGFLLPNVREIIVNECENFEGIIAAPSAILSGFPHLEKISISSCRNMMSLVVPEMLPCLQNLRKIYIWCRNLKTVFSLEVFLHLQQLEELDIHNCPDLEMVIKPASPMMPLTASATAYLTSFSLRNCPMIKRLLSHELLIHLYNLQTLEVVWCSMLEELTSSYDELNGDLCTVIPLPNLRILRLVSLPELRSIGAIAFGNSIEIIEVIEAPHIKRIPLQMSQLPNGLLAPPSSLKNIFVSNKDWWESLEWESQAVKDSLQSYVQLKI